MVMSHLVVKSMVVHLLTLLAPQQALIKRVRRAASAKVLNLIKEMFSICVCFENY